MTMFTENGWKPNEHMPPHDPGSLKDDLQQLLDAWKAGPEKVEGAEWIIPPARGKQTAVVGADYPHQAFFNTPGYSIYKDLGKKDSATKNNSKGRELSKDEWQEVKLLLDKLSNKGTRIAFEEWFKKNGMDESAMRKLKSMAESGIKKDE